MVVVDGDIVRRLEVGATENDLEAVSNDRLVEDEDPVDGTRARRHRVSRQEGTLRAQRF